MKKICAVIFLSLCGVFAFVSPFFSYASETPIATDTRIRTLVYGENEVYKVTTKYGYQSNIEFGPGEEITTISVGDPVAFKVTPAGRRLFIKALEEDRETNMTVVTNLRAYQFEISSVVAKNEELIYVVRFFYPDGDFDRKKIRKPREDFTGKLVKENYNFNYSLSGPDHIAPLRVFDDGRFTFFKFSGTVPAIYAVTPSGGEAPVVSRDDGEYIIVERVLPQFSLRRGDDVVCVFNDNMIRG